MKQIAFGQWAEVLAQSDLPERQKESWTILLKWYLGFCRRNRLGVSVQSAREFIEWVEREKQPQPWQVERWKEALNWFFREAKNQVSGARGQVSGATDISTLKGTSGAHLTPDTPHLAQSKPMPAWKREFLTVVRRRHYSYRTEQSYLVWLERFARFCRTEDLQGCGPEQIKAFLDELALGRRLSASSQRQALNAVVFLLREVYGKESGDFSDYRRAKVRTHAPVWLTAAEMNALLAQLPGQWGLMTRVAFGGGLRLMELLRLRIKDVDLEQEIITVRGGKGDKDRFVPLAHVVVEPLKAHLSQVRQIYERDRQEKVAGVWLPDGLERKYPKAGEEWPWFWFWPDDHVSVDPRSGQQRRHHVSDRLFQLRIKEAACRARLNKRVTPHVLRHSFASQSLDAGYHIRTVQELLGHKSVETTMIYTHVMQKKGLGFKSPLDSL